MADKLTTEEVVQLIKSYQSKECLWNRYDKHYRDFGERNKCYLELSDEFNLSEEEIKKKIVNLRTWFARVLRRIETSKKLQDETGIIYEPSSPIFDALLFLSDVLRRQIKTRRPMRKKSVDKTDAELNLELEEYIIQEKDSDVVDDSNAYDPIEEETYYMSPVLKNRSVEERQPKRMKFECSSPGKYSSNYLEDVASTNIEQTSDINYNSMKENDEIDYFCKSLASQMRKLTPRSMIELQMEIQNAVSNKRLEDWDKNYKLC